MIRRLWCWFKNHRWQKNDYYVWCHTCHWIAPRWLKWRSRSRKKTG